MKYDLANWVGGLTDKMVFIAPAHGGTDSVFGYHEGTQFGKMRVSGRLDGWADPNLEVTLLQLFDLGSSSEVGSIQLNGGDINLELVRGTPKTFPGSIASFSPRKAAVMLTGCAGATINFNNLEVDDELIFGNRAGWGRPAGCLLTGNVVKSEYAISPRFVRLPSMHGPQS